MQPILDASGNQERLKRAYASYLEGKTVAIVGRAGLHELEQGDLIESHDVVVRTHQAIPYLPGDRKKPYGVVIPPELHHLIGKRTDVLYHRVMADINLFIESDEIDAITREFVKTFFDQGGHFLCYEDPHPVPLRSAIVQELADVRYVDMSLYADLALAIKNRKQLNPGIVVIADVLRHRIKSAYITGFPSFFDDMGQYQGQAKKKEVWESFRDINQFRFLYKLSKHPSIEFDPFMVRLFKKHLTF